MSCQFEGPNPITPGSQEPGAMSLQDLPTEILQSIADLMTISSAASLAFTSKLCHSKLAARHIDLLKQRDHVVNGRLHRIGEPQKLTPLQEERQKFLLHLERDLPDQMFCFYCQQLHHPANPPTVHARSRPCYCLTPEKTTPCLMCDPFSFTNMYMVMKRHRLGLKQEPSFGKTIEVDSLFSPVHRLRLNSRIIDGKFYLRTMHLLSLIPGNPPRLPESPWILTLCAHAQSWRRADTPLQEALSCAVSHAQDAPFLPLKCSGLQQCDKCYSEYRIELDQANSTLRILQWQDFGEVRTPFDRGWSSHYTSLPQWKAEFSPGTIMRTFEGDDYVLAGDLACNNLSEERAGYNPPRRHGRTWSELEPEARAMWHNI